MHNPANNNCPKNADPRNETCSCNFDGVIDTLEARLELRKITGICAYGNCQNKVVGDRLWCEECRDNL